MELINRVKEIVYYKDYVTTDKDKELENIEMQEPLKNKNCQNTVALIETFDFHGECIASYAHYLLKMGYNVHLYILKKQIKDNPFINCNFSKDKFKIYTFTKFPTSDIFFKNLNNYHKVFVLTLSAKDNNIWAELIKTKYHNNNLYFIHHEVECYTENNTLEEYYKNNIFVLRSGIKYREKELPFVSPIYFGEYNNLLGGKNKNVKFVCITRKSQINSKNYETIFDNFIMLKKDGINNFKVIFTGLTQEDAKKFDITLIKDNLEFCGNIKFEELYKLVSESDFILYNIDSNTNDYKKYLDKGITGSYSLTMGFLVPAIVDKDLGLKYGIESCGILYSSGEFYNAIKQAIRMGDAEYMKLKNQIQMRRTILEEKSICNIKMVFEDKC